MAMALEESASRVELASREQPASREGPASDVDELLALRASVLSLAQRFDPAGLRPVELAEALQATTVTRNALGTIEALVAKAIKDASAFERGQDRSADHFVSRTLGTSVKNARDLLETAEALQSLPATEAAARRGELSGDQAQAVTRGASADPKAEGRLLETARQGSLGELKDEARRVRFAAAPDPEARRRRIFEQRSLRTYADDEGAFHLHLTHTAETGAKIKGALDPVIEACFEEARRKGRRERPEAYGADALVEALCGDRGGQPRSAHPKFIVRIDHAALVRGQVEGDELCEVVGVGPLSVAAIKELALAEDPFWTAIVTKGHDVVNVAHLGRHPSAFQRTALEWLYPGCAVRGCHQQVRIEWDHRRRLGRHPRDGAAQPRRALPPPPPDQDHPGLDARRGTRQAGLRGPRRPEAPQVPASQPGPIRPRVATATGRTTT